MYEWGRTWEQLGNSQSAANNLQDRQRYAADCDITGQGRIKPEMVEIGVGLRCHPLTQKYAKRNVLPRS